MYRDEYYDSYHWLSAEEERQLLRELVLQNQRITPRRVGPLGAGEPQFRRYFVPTFPC